MSAFQASCNLQDVVIVDQFSGGVPVVKGGVNNLWWARQVPVLGGGFVQDRSDVPWEDQRGQHRPMVSVHWAVQDKAVFMLHGPRGTHIINLRRVGAVPGEVGQEMFKLLPLSLNCPSVGDAKP